MRPLNIRQIEAFKAVMETGTVIGAAARLNVSQPAVSKLIAHLEIDAGLALFTRERGRLVPTDIGRELFEEVERTFLGLRQIETALENIRRQQRGQLRLGVMPALASGFSAAIISAFSARHPDVSVDLQVMSSRNMTMAVADGKVDIAICNSASVPDVIRCDKILPLPMICAMPKDHPLAQKQVITPQDLQGVDFIRFSDHVLTGAIVSNLFAEHGIEVKNRVYIDLVHPACELIAAGLGVSLFHPLYAMARSDRVQIRPFSVPHTSELYILYSYNRRNSKLVNSALREINNVAASMLQRLQNG